MALDGVGKVGGIDPFHHRNLPYEAYHHWAILDDETWSGTINLLGDVIVFPGATLTLEAGTVVEFLKNKDRHEFLPGTSLDCFTEIFVYGTLLSEGSTDNRVVSRGQGNIRTMTGGVVSQGDYTDVLNTTPAPSDPDFFIRCDPHRPPVLEGLLDLVVREYIDPDIVGPVDVGVYRNTSPNPNAPVWSLIGADASSFTLVQTSSNERTLQFKEPPNYEVPLAGGGYKTTYNVGVVVRDVPLSGAVGATDGAVSDTLLVSVTVVNVEEAGSVVLSPQPPQVGVALVARLTDPDEGLTFTGASWAWHRRARDAASWQPVSVPSGAAGATDNYPELSSYTPSSDVGYYLRASVRYTDHHGPNKSAEGTTSAPVFGPPPATVTAGWGRIRVAWSPVASARGYDVQGQGKPFDRGTWPTGWSSLATNIAGQRYAHRGVSPDSLYRYQVRSRMGATVSAWSDTLPSAAGVQPGVGAPRLTPPSTRVARWRSRLRC